MTIPVSLRQLKQWCSLKRAMLFWYRHYKVLFFLCFIVVLGLGGSVWYRSLYQYQWSDDVKKAYIEEHFKETMFKEQAFTDTVDRFVTRASAYRENPKLVRNLFSGAPLK